MSPKPLLRLSQSKPSLLEDFRMLFAPKSSVLAEMQTMAPEPEEEAGCHVVVLRWSISYDDETSQVSIPIDFHM